MSSLCEYSLWDEAFKLLTLCICCIMKKTIQRHKEPTDLNAPPHSGGEGTISLIQRLKKTSLKMSDVRIKM